MRRDLALYTAAPAALIAAALMWPWPAQAHPGYNRPNLGAAGTLENILTGHRVSRGLTATIGSISTLTAGVALNTANYREGRWTGRIGGEPFGVWSNQFFPKTTVRALTNTIRCQEGTKRKLVNGTYTPYLAYYDLKRRPNAAAVMSLPFWMWMNVRSATMHKHANYFSGKGRCIAYYVVWAGPLVKR